jgi:hypothetical protein
MFIKLTNAHPSYRDQEIMLNTQMIVSIYRAEITRDSGLAETVTFVHCPPHGTWEVAETLAEVSECLALAPKFI